MENLKRADLFTHDTSISDEAKQMVRLKLAKALKGKSEMLTFNVEKSSDGWVAVCKEIDGLIAGSNNPEPSKEEIEQNIRASIYAVFGVEEFEKNLSEAVVSPYFTYEEVNGVA